MKRLLYVTIACLILFGTSIFLDLPFLIKAAPPEAEMPRTFLTILDEGEPAPTRSDGVGHVCITIIGSSFRGDDGNELEKDDIKRLVSKMKGEQGLKAIVLIVQNPEKLSSLQLGQLVDLAASGLGKGERLHIIVKLKGLR